MAARGAWAKAGHRHMHSCKYSTAWAQVQPWYRHKYRPKYRVSMRARLLS